MECIKVSDSATSVSLLSYIIYRDTGVLVVCAAALHQAISRLLVAGDDHDSNRIMVFDLAVGHPQTY